MDFNYKMQQLENILNELENDTISLDKALKEYENGILIIRECMAYLEDAKQKIMVLSAEGQLEPYTKNTTEEKVCNND